MLPRVNMQEIIALALVGATAGVFAWRLARRRKTRPSGCCGCPGATGSARPGGFLLQARKHEPVRILIK
jgi:hypothetical protein